MSQLISFNELVANGFVPDSEQDRVRHYLEVRKRFVDIFSNFPRDDRERELLAAIEHVEQRAESICQELVTRCDFFRGEVLALLAELLRSRPEEQRRIEGRIRRLADLIPRRPMELPLRELRHRLELALKAHAEVEQALREVRAELN